MRTLVILPLVGWLVRWGTADLAVQSSASVFKHLAAVLIGLAVMYAGAMHFDYRRLRGRWVNYPAVAACAALLLVALRIGHGANGTQRFLAVVGPITIQPSELAKAAAVVFLADFLERNRNESHRVRSFFFPAVVIGLLAALILEGGDFSTALLLVGTASVMAYSCDVPLSTLFRGAAVALPAILSMFYYHVWQVQYRRDRIVGYLSSQVDPQGQGFQGRQSELALGSGGWLGNGWPFDQQTLIFLPASHNDFIFSRVGEILGFAGAAVLLGAFLLVILRGYRAALGAPDRFGRYLASGITTMIGLQSLGNISVASGLVPATGWTLPLLSAGNTSIVVSMTMAGILLNISSHSKR